jgi:D-alanyl-lipoteichoic acid acyltransferase DltB (MBOAT superfamily)
MYALILLSVTGITYLAALKIERKRELSKRTMIIGVIAGLIPLLFFKYFNFINEQVYALLSMVGLRYELQGLNWAVPIGISFFTFQAIGYVWDVYYKKINAEREFLTYALFISFFPSILSGPINKASLVIPQLKNLRPYFDYSKAVAGLRMILWGMFMKVVVADRMGLYVDTVLPNYMNYTGVTCFAASIFYTIQIYGDFAGYSLMAIGVGKTLGFELTENFRRPYFAVSVTDFWRRWHISLSTWLKDYIYIPFGGSRCSKIRNYWNIFVTFLVSGIWHGANWTFIIWGIWHGLFQIVEKMLGQQNCNYGWFGKSIKILVTFLLVNFAWIFFRMPTLEDACGVIGRIFDFSLPKTFFSDSMTTMFFMVIGIALLLFKEVLDEFYPAMKTQLNCPIWLRWGTYLTVLSLILLAGVLGSDQFIYANF